MIKMIVAYDENRVIGADNKLLWRIPEDMKNFKDKTDGQICIMGKETWFSLPEKFRPLPNRLNIIVTSGNSVKEEPGKVVVAKSIGSAIMVGRFSAEWGKTDINFIGGQGIYEEGLKHADEIWATEVHIKAETNGLDKVRRFPILNPDEWEEAWREDHLDAEIPFSFVLYKRRRS